jgi:hypothetical protein
VIARPGTPASASDAFVRQALREAERYGPDRWVLVRELVQNARDAGASRVEIRTEISGRTSRLVCSDDGEGMTWAHAQAYLLTLYASSKEDRSDQAGRFGVGFWSVLRFAPDRITVRSQPVTGEGWELELNRELTPVSYGVAVLGGGTEIVLERDAPEPDLAEQVLAAARRDVALVTRRDAPSRPLQVRVNGRPVHTEELQLPPPSATFHSGGVRGAVGLSAEPRIELFCRGFRVRTARSFDELLSSRRHGRSEISHRERLGGALAPVVLLDSADLEVVLARSDVREDAALEALVDRAQRELRRLVSRQLDRGFALPWRQRLGRIAGRPAVRWLALVAVAVVLGWVLGRTVPGLGPTALHHRRQAVRAEPSRSAVNDLGQRYRGAVVDVPSGDAQAAYPVTYRPADLDLLIAQAVVDPVATSGALDVEQLEPCGRRRSLPGPTVDMSVVVAGSRTPVRLPVPTGHAVVPGSARLDGRQLELRCTPRGEPVVVGLGGASGASVRYQTAPVAAEPTQPSVGSAGAVPPAVVATIRAPERSATVERAVGWVVARMRYERSAAVAQQHRELAAADASFLDRCLAVGAGDCDVLNGLVVQLLNHAGVPARLVIGFVGRDGGVAPELHAWAEVVLEDRWTVVDASTATEGGRDATGGPDPETVVSAQPDGGASVAAPDHTGALSWRLGGWVALAVVLGLAGVGGVWLAHRSRRQLRLAASVDAAAWLEGALEEPEAFIGVEEVWHRPLVPLVDGRISLHQARQLAVRGKLWAASSAGELKQAAVGAGRAVVDCSDRAGQVVATALGAADLDLWERWLSTRVSEPLLDRVGGLTRGRWRFAVADGVPHSPQAMAEPAAEGVWAGRWLVWSADDPVLARARALAREGRPQHGLLLLLESAAARCAPEEWEPLLANVARAALRERAGATGR